jgi:hypothetical protein
MTLFDNIPDLFADIAAKVDEALFSRDVDPFHVYFDYGHYAEVTRNLTNKDGGVTTKNKKYPLIWLVMDFVERRGELNFPVQLPDLHILIATKTDVDSTTPKRIASNFKPRLYPIYRELLYQMGQSGYFTVTEPETIPHEKIDRPFWGGQDVNGANGVANLFNDHIDAIQVRKIKLFVNEQICLT